MSSKINILVIGSGGREHALVRAINRSSNVNNVYVAPGNGGISKEAQCVDIGQNDFLSITNFCKQNDVDLVVVGPEEPLVKGISDYLEERGIKVFGPSARASLIEGSKQFMKDIVSKYNVPTADYKTFTSATEAKDYVKKKGAPIVVKTDGLAAGKGVTVAQSVEEAIQAIDENFKGKFGTAGKKLIIEDFMEGEEASFFVISDGKTVHEFGSAQDHKCAYDGDKGPNTGGMGTYSPAPIITDMVRRRVMRDIIQPTIDGLAKDGIPYKGFLFAGLMIDKNSQPRLLEYNIRMGDPETQSILPRLNSDIVEILFKAACRRLGEVKKIHFSPKSAMCVVMAAEGYPEKYEKGHKINLSATSTLSNVIVFHAGTILEKGKFLSSGGRVLGVTGLGDNLEEARHTAYSAISKIKADKLFYRKDIGYRELSRKN